MHRKFCISTFVILSVAILAFTRNAPSQSSGEDPAKPFYELTVAAQSAFNAGELEKAAALSNRLLADAENWKSNWNYGNAIHVANLVLGRIEIVKGDNEKAGKFLLAAGRTPGSPQLKTFGPDMIFAREMLQKGETKVVLEYFDLCAKFWERKGERLASWKEAVERGEIPDFGPNVRYFF